MQAPQGWPLSSLCWGQGLGLAPWSGALHASSTVLPTTGEHGLQETLRQPLAPTAPSQASLHPPWADLSTPLPLLRAVGPSLIATGRLRARGTCLKSTPRRGHPCLLSVCRWTSSSSAWPGVADPVVLKPDVHRDHRGQPGTGKDCQSEQGKGPSQTGPFQLGD